MKKGLWIILALAVLIILYGVTAYNRLVGLSQSVNNQWAQVETQYQRRFDLIPNLVESVKGIMEQEQDVFGNLADARTRYAGATSPDDRASAATEVEGALARLLVVMENYPELRSTETVQTLMVQLEGTENRIGVERKRYNDTVKDFNVTIKRIPTNIFAAALGYSEKIYFESAEGADTAPKVDLME